MSLVSTWRLPLRIARRDALRHRGRSILTLVMIALPVLAVTSADVLISTSDVSGTESIDRRMGSAQALVSVTDGITKIEQGPDPDRQLGNSTGSEGSPRASADQVSSLLGGAQLLEQRQAEIPVGTDKGTGRAEVTELDLRDPLADGLFDLTSGRLPEAAGEVVVNRALADKGYAVGDTLDLGDDATVADPTIVGIAESATVRTFPVAVGPLGAFGIDTEGSTAWLVGGGSVSWATVQQLNGIGATVASRAVLEDPPPESEWPASVYTGSSDTSGVAVIVLIVVMALIEVVLLAGPAFAVGARKQQRSLALMVATGGTPKQSRRVVIGSAIVLGSVASVLGVVLGLGLARAIEPLLQSHSDSYFGPFDVRWLHLLGVAAFGLVSAFLAAIVPATIASRQDVVAVLAGRRGDRAPSLRSPLLGLVLLGIGIAGSAFGAVQQGGGELLIAGSAIPAVLGMILLVPVVVAGLARVSGRLPLVLRYAVRDAARHRTRTVPAVAAVAATVAGVVALGVGLSSDQAENRETYTATLPDGVGMVHSYGDSTSWATIEALLRRELPGATVTEQQGLDESSMDPAQNTYTEVVGKGGTGLLGSSSDSLGASIMASDDALPTGLVGVSAADATAASAALRAGTVVAFEQGPRPASDTVTVVRHRYDEAGNEADATRVRAAATYIQVSGRWLGPVAVVPTAVATQIGIQPTTVALAITGATITKDQETDVSEALASVDENTSVYVERGYQADPEALVAQLILIGLGGVLMLGGTLTATFLALSDARPDLATLAAVGASPRTRRGVAAAYAVVVGGVGALLGAAVGFIPGLAVTWPLTSTYGDTCVVVGSGSCEATGADTGPFIDVPWLMILGLVIVLPLLTALVVGLFARSRLPLVARLE